MSDAPKRKEPRDAMRVFGAETAKALDTAARLGAPEERLARERQYLLRALRALLGEHGDEADTTHKSLQLKGSGVTVQLERAKGPNAGEVARITLEYGKARQGRERDAKYYREDGAWNVQRIALRAFLLHERWLAVARAEADRNARLEEARKEFLDALAEVRPGAAALDGAGKFSGDLPEVSGGLELKEISWEVRRLPSEAGEALHGLDVRLRVRSSALGRVLRAIREI